MPADVPYYLRTPTDAVSPGRPPSRWFRTVRPRSVLLCALLAVVMAVPTTAALAVSTSATTAGRGSATPHGPDVATGEANTSPGLDDWTTYGSDLEHSGSNAAETAISPEDASHLQLAWTTELNGSLIGSLMVANGTAYAGDLKGYLVALNTSDGTPRTPASSHPWATPFLGNTSYSTCGGGSGSKAMGILATPTLVGNRIYESGGNTSFYTLSLDGQILQRVDLANDSDSPWYYDYNWASPLIYHGSAYLGLAAQCNYNNSNPNPARWQFIQGQLLQLNLTTGTIVGRFNATKGTSAADRGGDIWATATADPETNTVWVTTGNENGTGQTPSNGEYPRSMVALNATTLQFEGACQVGSLGADDDYGAGPTLFTDADGDRMVGAINKDGTFSAYNASVPTGGNCGSPGSGNLRFSWADAFCTGSTPGTISPAAFDGQHLYIASDGCGGNAGVVDQVDPNNGTVRWSHSLTSPDAEAHAGVAVADGVVVIAANNLSTGNVGNGVLEVLNASDGNLLFEHNFSAETNAWPVVAEGTIFVAIGNDSPTDPGWVAAFRVPLGLDLHVPDASCTGNPIARCTTFGPTATLDLSPTGGVPPYECHWTFGDSTVGSTCEVSHSYSAPGAYPVSVVVTDGNGSRVATNLTVTVPTVGPGNSTGTTPPIRFGTVFDYDAADNETLLFGGTCSAPSCGGQVLDDTWVFAAGHWTNLTGGLALAPPPLTFSAFAYDPTLDGVVLFGGAGPGDPVSSDLSNATWEFAGGTWTNLTGPLTGAPPAEFGAAATYDPAVGALLMFGGAAGNNEDDSILDNSTWTLSNGSWHNTTGPVGPTPRDPAGFAYDPVDREAVLFGGTGIGPTTYNDTWAYRAGWFRVNSTVTPPTAQAVALASEGPNASVLLWDGLVPDQTYQFTGGEWENLSETPHPSGTSAWPVGTLAGPTPYDLLLDGSATWVFRNSAWAEVPPVLTLPGPPAPASAPVSLTVVAELSGGVAPLTYRWTVAGASVADAGSSLTYRFAEAGTFPVTVQVRDAIGEDSFAETNVTVLAPFTDSFVNFADRADAGTPVSFTATSTGGVGSESYTWNFNDGTAPGTGGTIAHTFAISGTYRVELTATDGVGDQANVSQNVSVAPPLTAQSPRASAGADIDQPFDPAFVVAGGTFPMNESVAFGDGTNASAAWNSSEAVAPEFLHQFAASGPYTVSLTVVDALGVPVFANVTLTVEPPLATPRITVPSTATVDVPVAVSGSASGGLAPYEFLWSFGDSLQADEAAAHHSYDQPGTYTVQLLVTDADERTASATAVINVHPAVNPILIPVVIGSLGVIAVGAAVGFWWIRKRTRLRPAEADTHGVG
jgi:PKD repeat protein